MCTQDNTPGNFQANNKEDFNSSSEKKEKFCIFKESELNEIIDLNPVHGSPIENAALLGFIRSYSTLRGFAYFQDETFLSQTGWKKTKLRAMLKFLYDNKFIYINSWNTKAGRKRHIIPKENAHLYRDKWMKIKDIPKEIKDKYADHFELARFSTQTQCRSANNEKPNIVQRHCHAKSPSDSASLRSKDEYKQGDSDSNAAASSNNSSTNQNKSLPGKKISEMLGPPKNKPLSEKEEALKELRLLPRSKEMETIITLVDKHWDNIRKLALSNPKGLIFDGIKKGYILKKLQAFEEKEKEQQQATKQKDTVSHNKEKSQNFKKEIEHKMRLIYPPQTQIKLNEIVYTHLNCHPVSFSLRISISRGSSENLITQTVFEKEISYKDPSFDKYLEDYRRKLHEVL